MFKNKKLKKKKIKQERKKKRKKMLFLRKEETLRQRLSLDKRDELTKAQCIAKNTCEKKFQKNDEDELNFSKIIINKNIIELKISINYNKF